MYVQSPGGAADTWISRAPPRPQSLAATRMAIAMPPGRACRARRRMRILTACVTGAAAVAATSAAATGGQRRLFSDTELDAFADEVKRTGSALLKGVLAPQKLRDIREAYSSVLAARIERAGPDRGPARYYATPPFVMPFADPEIFQQADILGVVRRLVGDEPVLCQWAGDTPMGVTHSDPRLPGASEFQDVHRDAAPLYPVRSIRCRHHAARNTLGWRRWRGFAAPAARGEGACAPAPRGGKARR